MNKRWLAVAILVVFGGSGMAQQGCGPGSCPQRPANCPQAPGAGPGRQVQARQGQRQGQRPGQQQRPGQAAPPAAGRGQGWRGGNAGRGQGRGGAGQGQGGGQAAACDGPCRNIGQQPIALPPALLTQLQGTLAEELFARDFYQAAAQRFAGRRFHNLARAEQNHADALARAIRSAGAEPVAVAGRPVELPAELAGVEAAAAQLERDMIAAFEVLLGNPAAAPLEPMLASIQAANHRHLAASQR